MQVESRTRTEGATLAEIEAVYRVEAQRYFRLARAVVGGDEEARDAVQDALAGAVRARRTYRGDGSLEAWLWRAVPNAARSRRRRPAVAGLDPESGYIRQSTGSPRESDAAADVRAAVARLPERQRHVLFLRYYADLDYEAIAETLDVSPNTVGPTLAAAQATLRTLLEGAIR
jgi:RNA polymerase sigma-70 factor (ECF subfamily)